VGRNHHLKVAQPVLYIIYIMRNSWRYKRRHSVDVKEEQLRLSEKNSPVGVAGTWSASRQGCLAIALADGLLAPTLRLACTASTSVTNRTPVVAAANVATRYWAKNHAEEIQLAFASNPLKYSAIGTTGTSKIDIATMSRNGNQFLWLSTTDGSESTCL
jgi:hypothetical protein